MEDGLGVTRSLVGLDVTHLRAGLLIVGARAISEADRGAVILADALDVAVKAHPIVHDRAVRILGHTTIDLGLGQVAHLIELLDGRIEHQRLLAQIPILIKVVERVIGALEVVTKAKRVSDLVLHDRAIDAAADHAADLVWIFLILKRARQA